MSWRAPAATLLAATTLFLACERRAPSEGPAEILIHSSPRESSELFVDTGDLARIRERGTLRVLVTDSERPFGGNANESIEDDHVTCLPGAVRTGER